MTKLKGRLAAEPRVRGSVSTEPSIRINMTSGARGKSAYEIWLDNGGVGSVEDFFESIKGADGQSIGDYIELENKPSIESVELVGNTTFEDLGMESIEKEDIKRLL